MRPAHQRRHRAPAARLQLRVRKLAVCWGLLSALGCATPGPEIVSATDSLAAALAALPGSPDPTEAARLAQTAIDTTAALRLRYRPLRPPQLGNLAFHLGLRERALCCHWARDLLHALSATPLESFELHWGVAHEGGLREHSSVVAVPSGGRFEQGLVLDAWRHSGRLHWSRVDRDTYPWRLHSLNAQRMRLRCVPE